MREWKPSPQRPRSTTKRRMISSSSFSCAAPLVRWSAGKSISGAAENLAAVGERYGPSIDVMQSRLPGQEPFHGHDVADLQGILFPAAAVKNIRRSAFNGPVLHLAAGILHVDVIVDVGIHPFDLGHRSFQRYRLFLVILRCSGVMRRHRLRRQNNPDNHGSKQSASHRNTSEMVPALKTKNRCRPETNWRCWSCQGLHERDCPARRLIPIFSQLPRLRLKGGFAAFSGWRSPEDLTNVQFPMRNSQPKWMSDCE